MPGFVSDHVLDDEGTHQAGPNEKSSPKQDFLDLLKNNPWKIMLCWTLVHFCILSFRGGALYNYYHHYADKAAMFDWVQNSAWWRRRARRLRRHFGNSRLHRPRRPGRSGQLKCRGRVQQHHQHARHRHHHHRDFAFAAAGEKIRQESRCHHRLCAGQPGLAGVLFSFARPMSGAWLG